MTNTYKIDIPRDKYNVSDSFNVKDLAKYYGDEDHDPWTDLSQGGGDDVEHPSIIPMDSTPTHQAPHGPMTRSRARALETEVNSFLVDMHMDTSGTWFLPHQNTLCVIRYEEEHPQAAREHHQGVRGPLQGHAEQDGAAQHLDRRSQATPCAR